MFLAPMTENFLFFEVDSDKSSNNALWFKITLLSQ